MKIRLIKLIMFTTAVLAFILPNILRASMVEPREICAKNLKGSHIILDGKLSEAVWSQAEKSGNFTQRNPNDGRTATLKTEFSILYDDNYLYAGIRAWDDEPEKITGILTRRDEYTSSDWLYVSIDSYNDNRTAFEFGLNAAGVKHDLRRYNDDNADEDWDAVWDGQVNIDDKGWTAEFRIPLRELRFVSVDNMEWGLMVYREIPRFENELSVWNHWSRKENGFVSNYGRLTGLVNIKSENPIYVSPYFLSSSNISDTKVNSLHTNNYDFLNSIGGDIRYSFSNGLTVDATFNPDFGQVEADPAEFNLTQFESYFSEKRPFFIEGSNIFEFNGFSSNSSLFYSRRIGRAPVGSYSGDPSAVYSERPNRTTILSAAKLTGRTNNGVSIGVLSTVTDEEQAIEFLPGDSTNTYNIEPRASYSVGRVQKDFRDGGTTLGVIATSTFRDLNGSDLESVMHDKAYSGGIDFSHEFFDRNYNFRTAVSFSEVQGSKEAILRTQTGSGHFFQRPDATHLNLDEEAVSLGGYSGIASLAKTSGSWRYSLGVSAISPGFEVNDLGYNRRADDIDQWLWVSYRDTEPGKTIREYQLNINQWTGLNFAGELAGRGGNVNGNMRFNNNYSAFGGIGINLPGLNYDHLRGGNAIATSSGANMWYGFNSDDRKDFGFGYFGFVFVNADDVFSSSFSPNITYRPRKNIQISLNPEYQYFDDTWAWATSFYDNEGIRRYVFSDLFMETFSLTMRLDITLRTNLSIQFYASPFMTAGHYSTFREVDQNLEVDFDKRFSEYSESEIHENIDSDDGRIVSYEIDRDSDGINDHIFGNPDFNYKQMNTNMVIRWEYNPGSSVYLVWSTGKSDYEQTGTFNFSADSKRLLKTTGDNVFLLKFSYLLAM